MINLSIPQGDVSLQPRITVVGVGGAGGNAVNNMIRAELQGVEFLVANTDAQALAGSEAPKKLQLGVNLTQGLGAGSRPDIGKAAAEEQIDEIAGYLEGSHMVFITAGMGGGTGTGAAPVIARAARELGILTVGVVTKPFHFEGAHRMRIAEQGLSDLQQYVDTLIIIPNQNLFRIANERTTFADAFRMADEVLHSGVRGVTDLMVQPGLINLDFADIRTVMAEMGKAMMGTGEGEGERRAIMAAEAAISNPLLDDVSMKGAKGVLINITGGLDMTLYEVDEATNRIRDEVDPDANIIFGSTFNPDMEGRVRVSVVATGIDSAAQAATPPVQSVYTGRGQPLPQRPPLVTVTSPPLGPPRPAVAATATEATEQRQPEAPETAAQVAAAAPSAEGTAAPAAGAAAEEPRAAGRPAAPSRPMIPQTGAVPARPEGRSIPAVPPRTIVAPAAGRTQAAGAGGMRVVSGGQPVTGTAAAGAVAAGPVATGQLATSQATAAQSALAHAVPPPAASPEAAAAQNALAAQAGLGQTAAVQPTPAAAPAEPVRRTARIGLFHRITGMLGVEDDAMGGRGAAAAPARQEREAPAPQRAEQRVEPPRLEKRADPARDAAARSEPARPAARPVIQPSLAIDGGRARSSADDDALDIPAFLRRQAN